MQKLLKEFECKKCGLFEEWSDSNEEKCPICGEKCPKIFSVVASPNTITGRITK